ncbi:ferrous iron transport protein B [Candidatus Sulfidibacterium hydrothermale]|uniref:ferrous iron transport protein B n=1 Tax=Candidatus Sulfidibacterium hydrothermale TaxID=2875962 RepID=UPI001F0B1F40|nr:ferrous iron transport protein B [Candidatus Sulfidibacterium hydrothermale]UBM61132.1 ferrous iron transport protein B [Candidatus Sulfidibacterium hydrothermale]
MTLAELKTGEKAIITKVRGRGAFRKRIIEMGFVVGKLVTVVKNAPLKDPVEYNIMGYEVSLRRSEAALIEVTKDLSFESPDNKFRGTFEVEEQLNITPAQARSKVINVALVGNPNCGKTTIFNYASHSKEKVGNYGGVTIDAKEATFEHRGYTFKLVDLPGTYSITSYTPEERYVRNHIINELPDIILNVIDSSNLERNLYLTTQLIDMDMKVVMALNMWDEFLEKGDILDYEALSKMLGIPMVHTVGSKGRGIGKLFNKLIEVYEDREPTIRHIHINYGHLIEDAIKKLQLLINQPGNEALTVKISPRYLSLKLLERDPQEIERVKKYCVNADEILALAQQEAESIEKQRKETMETIITDAKYGFIEGALRETLTPAEKKDKITMSRIIDTVVTGKLLSYPIFLFAMWLTFESTFYIGNYPMQWIQDGVNALGELFTRILPPNAFRDLIVDGIIGGVGGVIVFLPNILILFFFITLMEASGYMARVAFIVDKLMHKIGLHGKSFVPMLMGFGCNVPAIMATRTIENKNDRLVTMLIIPFMSCSARYPVYILIISAFFPSYQGTILFGIYLFGIFLAGVMAWIFKKTLFKANTIPFVMELPPYRMPRFSSVLKQTWFKGEMYLKKMGTVILLASLIIWALGYFPLGKKYEAAYKQQVSKINEQVYTQLKKDHLSPEQIKKLEAKRQKEIDLLKDQLAMKKQENSYIGRIGHFIEPVIRPLGFDWKMGVSLVAGGAAKEVVVSTMGVLYPPSSASQEKEGLSQRLREQVYNSGPRKGEKVFTPLVAMSFLLFILIYFPCVAVVAAIKHETGQWKWSLFLATYTTTLAWIIAFIVYQGGRLLGF